MAGRIYQLNDSSKLMAMEETPYDSEKLLQELLANHPDLLAGEQVNVEQPRRWLLVTREMSVPDQEDGNSRWSLDHLFLDQDAIPTLVEVKQSTDTRIRRKVVGQMLDYAANAVAYWPTEKIKAKFEAQCEANGDDPEQELADHLADDEAAGEFWQQVKTNLQACRIRMVFVADVIPAELRRVIEFLNEQMDPAEVIGIEIRQYVGEGIKTLVPRVVGQTEAARKNKHAEAMKGEKWSEALFMQALCDSRGPAVQTVAQELVDWITRHVDTMSWRKGKLGTVAPTIHDGKMRHMICRINTNGRFVFRFDSLYKKRPFSDEALRRQLLAKINEIPTADFGEDVLTKRASIPLEALADRVAQEKLKSAVEWMIAAIRAGVRSEETGD